jgi:hypothetical protein
VLGNPIFDFASHVTPALRQAVKEAGADRNIVVLTTDGIEMRTELP